MRYGIVVIVAAALIGGAAGSAFAKGTFKGTFGDVRFKSKKFAVGCNYNRSLGFFIVTGSQSKKGGRLQSGAAASGFGTDPSVPGTGFPIVLADPVATFFDGLASSPTLWTGTPGLGNEVVLTLTGYKRGKVFGRLTAVLTLGTLAGGSPISVNASFNAKCTIQ
jgi:hypothetical protein